MKRIACRVLRKFGLRKQFENLPHKNLLRAPLNPNLHFEYALQANKQKRSFLAYSELKTAIYLGLDDTRIEEYKNEIFKNISPLELMNHNQFYRLKSLADELQTISMGRPFSVLDVGGGEGWLAAFIPDASYCLVEPTINGISGIELPFADEAFDYVVSCHVLEHISIENRTAFLDQLLAKSKYGLILLNPFYIEDTYIEDRLKLIIDITNADWAKEHLEYSLPTLEAIKEYAKLKELEISIKPNGTLTTTLALVFFDYFAPKLDVKKWQKINHFFNTNMMNILDSELYPTAHMIFLKKKS